MDVLLLTANSKQYVRLAEMMASTKYTVNDLKNYRPSLSRQQAAASSQLHTVYMTEIYFVLWPFCCRRSLMYIYFPWSWDRQDCSSVWPRLCRVVLFVSFTLYGLKYVIVCHNYIHCCAVSISVVCLVAPSDWDEGCCPQVKIMANSLVVYGSTRLFVLFSICWV